MCESNQGVRGPSSTHVEVACGVNEQFDEYPTVEAERCIESLSPGKKINKHFSIKFPIKKNKTVRLYSP